MKRLLISILSDYLQPNFLLIKQFDGQYDELVFVTTETMHEKNKGLCLERALGLQEDSVLRIPVIEDDYDNIIKQLDGSNFSKDDEYILNLTGGTKLMTIAVNDYFRLYQAKSYYVPIGKNLIRGIYDEETVLLTYRMNLKEYFSLNGLRYESDNSLKYDEKHTNDLFASLKKVWFNRKKITELRDCQTLPSNTDKRYYGGEWFEEYCYNRLKAENNLKDDEICKNARIFRDDSIQNDNEIDVMFVKDNLLHIFECKVGMTGHGDFNEVVSQYMYKLAAISKDFGLRVNSYILSLHYLKRNPKVEIGTLNHLQKRMNVLGIKGLLDTNDFVKKTNLLDNVTPINIDVPRRLQLRPQEEGKIELKIVDKIDLSTISKK